MAKNKATTATTKAFDATAMAETIAKRLTGDATVKTSATRVSIRIKGQPRQVLGIVPGKGGTVEISSPNFTAKHTPGMVSRRNYNLITLKNPSQDELLKAIAPAFKAAQLMK